MFENCISKGILIKTSTKNKQDPCSKLQLSMVLEKKDIEIIKESIKKLNESSIKEKESLTDSIEMLWLNAGVQKKKKDIKLSDDENEHISRIRQLLAAAWSEDLKE